MPYQKNSLKNMTLLTLRCDMIFSKKEKNRKEKIKVIFVLPHSFESLFHNIKKDINNIVDLDHFSSRYIDFMIRKSAMFDMELFALSSEIKEPLRVKHKAGFYMTLFPRDFKSFLPLETSTSMMREISLLCRGPKKIIWHLNSYYLIMSDPIIFLLKKYHQRVIVHHRGGGFTLRGLPYSIYKYCIMNPISLRLADIIMVENKDERRRLISYYKISPDKIVYAPNPIETSLIPMSKIESRKKLGIPATKKVLLFSGRLESIKGIYPFIKALISIASNAALPNFLFLVIGEGKQKMKIQSLIHAHNVKNIKLLNWQKRADLFKYYSAADLFVHPNSKSEGCPNTLVEVQSASLPVVAFDIEGVRDVISNEQTGKLVKKKKMSELSKQSLKLLYDDKKLDVFATNAKRNYEKNFKADIIFQIYAQTYISLYHR